MTAVQISMFYKVKEHRIKGIESYILTNEIAHIKVTKNVNTAMFLKYIKKLNILNQMIQ